MIAHDSVRMPRMKEALVQTVFILSLSIPFGNSESFDNISFNFPSFQLNDERITFQGNASVLNSIIQLTIGEPLEEPIYIVGRALYHQPMHLWDSSTGNVADFVSQFTFSINSRMKPLHADGFVFFLAPSGSQIPERSEGGFLGLTGFGWYGYKLTRNGNDHSGEEEDVLTVDEGFEQSKGPKKYSYKVLAVATNNFANSRLLGAGGFGEVYEGHLADAKSHVAIKKITPNSKQGIKEYATEVKTIRHLRHKNLVELIGWCHEKNEFLLMYEFMANGSLDSHLFKDKIPLTWERRYNIAQGIALGLKYLHEDLKHCVVHRDIKSSNILLDAHFEAKLGDFGLARMFDHAKGSQTTVSAGTLGYLAPECIYKGKASKESDIYSFGVVLLEIACGRKAIDLRASEDQVQLVEWVWELYGIGKLLNAADPKLGKNFDTRQIECLMIVGLWCAHPDPKERPPISRAIAFLNFDASPPILPLKLPIPTYIAPPTSTPELSHISSSNFRSSEPSSTYSTEPSAFTSSS
ncbi:L-type lectin-domain containing receptor kinase IX.1 isoform X2 [Eucalyptus grandis]|uniref:L-type lectin-domain containing receptor kinase IX.1 isoform X2 n=1 Tax=Eucalyptus grandis TaxID=71139 RepID=UPI00192E7DD0|nr:L-type lectin-domain containing receptor kinase IX.1 isoform X2 [Eucalyptus grandis]